MAAAKLRAEFCAPNFCAPNCGGARLDVILPQELFDLISRVNDTVNYLSGLSKRGTVATRGCGECKLHEYGGDDGFDDSSR